MPDEIDLNEQEEKALQRAWKGLRKEWNKEEPIPEEPEEEPIPEEPVNDIKSIRRKYRKR